MQKFMVATFFGFVLSFFTQSQLHAKSWEPIPYDKADRIVRDVYQSFLMRAPFHGELEHWRGRIVRNSYPEITDHLAASIANSPQFAEAIRRYGALEVVDNVYHGLFNRHVDRTGENGWVVSLNRGLYQTFVFGVLAGAEFQNVYGIRLR